MKSVENRRLNNQDNWWELSPAKPLTLQELEEFKDNIYKDTFVPEPTHYSPKCPACGKFVAYGRLSVDLNEYGLWGYKCNCGWNSKGV